MDPSDLKTSDDPPVSRAESPTTDHGHDDYDHAGEFTATKEKDILEACEKRDVEALVRLAESKRGFLTDELRGKAWPILLGAPDADDEKDDWSWKELPRHRDEEQVQLDVNRSFVYYPNDLSESELDHRKSELSDLIVSVLRQNPHLHYFQGYHDICQVFVLALPSPALRKRLVARLSALRIRDFMLPTLDPTVAQLRLIPDLLAAAHHDRADAALQARLAATEPFYALAGTLTMYAHDVQKYTDIARLFDALLAREPAFSVYMFARIVLDRREELFDDDKGDGALADALADDDPSLLHLVLSKVPQQLDMEALITGTAELVRQCPPQSLRAWRRISNNSCLKTARPLEICNSQTLADGEEFFQQHIAELRAAERRKKLAKAVWAYRRSAGAVGLAVAVGLLAIYLRRTPGSALPRPLASLVATLTGWTWGLFWRSS